MENSSIARTFDELADRLELMGEAAFKLRAYRAFADTVRSLDRSLAELAAEGKVVELDGVGKAIAAKVDELLRTGTFAALERARAEVPTTLLDVLRVRGIGAKTVRALWEKAGITTLAELVEACEEGRIATLPGFGERKQERALASARFALEGAGSMTLGMALDLSRRLRAILVGAGAAAEVEEVGSARRGVDIVRALTVLVRGASREAVVGALEAARAAGFRELEVTEGGDVALDYEGGARVRVRVVDAGQWLASLVRETGSLAHVVWLEGLAASHGGLDRACARAGSEEELYASLGLPYARPERREGPTPRPQPVLDGVRGVFHVHTDWSDGTASIVEMARAARVAGFGYVGISDHSRAATYANGLDPTRLALQAAAVDVARREVPEIRIFHGVEVDVLEDGALDLDDATLSTLDFVIASVHSELDLGRDEMTERMVRAVSHPLVTMLGHPTGRLLLGRRGYRFDLDRVARAAAANDTWLELNANPQRLDLSDANAARAASLGARLVINPDAHALNGFADVPLGVTVARRAGLAAKDVANAMGGAEVEAALAARKKRARA